MVGCSGGGTSAGGNDDNGGGSNVNTGKDNTTDMVVTGGLNTAGMTFAEVLGYTNIPEEYKKEAAKEGFSFYVGVKYGESPNNLNKEAHTYYDGRAFSVDITNLEANKTYYYRSFLRWGYGYDVSVIIGEATDAEHFTTKEAVYNGTMTVSSPSDVTFLHASFSANADVSSLDSRETYFKGLIYSTNQSDLSGDLMTKLRQAQKENYDDGHGHIIEEVVIGVGGEEYYAGRYYNGNLHFQVSDDANVRITAESGATVYYAPFIIISEKSFIGNIGEVTLRSLPVTSGFVDLGLSCLWAATNLDASSPWEFGWSSGRQSDALSAVSARSGGGRLPTIDEAMELNSCQMESIDGGLLITGPNGNQIFLTDRESTLYAGYITAYTSYYWTSSSKSKTILGSKSNYDLCFYGSGNEVKTYERPDLPYPYNMNQEDCYVRAVKDVW
ncbi:MAG: fibronectin type III domain-containing protein [Prevotella sp.]|nr:fibronectin type III domain-containing protein [Prevotella sp.]